MAKETIFFCSLGVKPLIHQAYNIYESSPF